MECGGKRSATPLSPSMRIDARLLEPVAKAPSPLRSAAALHMVVRARCLTDGLSYIQSEDRRPQETFGLEAGCALNWRTPSRT
jgi:hypothetical protein